MITSAEEYRAAILKLKEAQQRYVAERDRLAKTKISKVAAKVALQPLHDEHMAIQAEILAHDEAKAGPTRGQASASSPAAPAARRSQPKPKAPKSVAAAVAVAKAASPDPVPSAPAAASTSSSWYLKTVMKLPVTPPAAPTQPEPSTAALNRVVLVAAPAHLAQTGAKATPLSSKPKHQKTGKSLPIPDRSKLAHARAKIHEYANAEGYWVTSLAFTPPRPLRLVVLDYYLLVVVNLWLERVTSGESIELRHEEDIIAAAMIHPGKQHLMQLNGEPLTVGETWPKASSRGWLQFGRDLNNAGYVRQEIVQEDGRAAYYIQPTENGLVRGLWAARNIGLTLPVIG